MSESGKGESDKKPPRLVPFVFFVGLGVIVVLQAMPWKQQTPWSMVCVTVITVAGLAAAYMGDLTDEDDDGDAG